MVKPEDEQESASRGLEEFVGKVQAATVQGSGTQQRLGWGKHGMGREQIHNEAGCPGEIHILPLFLPPSFTNPWREGSIPSAPSSA